VGVTDEDGLAPQLEVDIWRSVHGQGVGEDGYQPIPKVQGQHVGLAASRQGGVHRLDGAPKHGGCAHASQAGS
jgi:hypothetical protein